MSAASREEIDRAVAGQTVVSLFADTAREHGDRAALRWRNPDDSWSETTWAGYADQAARVAGGLKGMGVRPGDRVVLMMRNRPEFHVADMAVLLCGATPISIYNSSAPEQVQYLVSHCEATVAIVEDGGFLERFQKVRSELPALREIALIEATDGPGGDEVTPWAQLLASTPVALDEAARVAKPEDLVTVIYTSGTTGPPKGVMLSHYNVCWTAESMIRLLGRDTIGFRAVSYLPMAHIAERMTSHYLGIGSAFEVTTCPEPTLLGQYLPEVRPQTMFGVPRIWEKINAGVCAALSARDSLDRFDEAVEAAKPIAQARAEGRELTAEEQGMWDFLDEVAFRQVRELVGLDQVRFAITGAAPIPPELIEWYRALGMPMSEIYGMSENSGPLTWDPERVKIGTVGRALPGVEVKLLEDGEVVGRGGNIFVGYLKDPEKTAETLDADGWLHTGDIGVLDDEGYLSIVDRKKELIITAGGKNISPANIEAALKAHPLVGQAAVIGDRRPFISALIVLDPDVAPSWAKQHGIEGETLAELANDPMIREEVEKGVAEANKRFSQVERVKRFAILGEEWLPDSQELTPTMKLKRRGINEKYAAEIEALYAR